MMIKDILQIKNMSMYRLAKDSGVPYTTIQEIISGKVKVEKCSAETIYKIAQVLDVQMEEILQPFIVRQSDFEIFKKSLRKQVNDLGDFEFVGEILNKNDIRNYHKKNQLPQCYYLLALVDYLCNENGLPAFTDYDDIRKERLPETLYPAEVVSLATALKDDNVLREAYQKGIDEFKHFNIIETDIRA